MFTPIVLFVVGVVASVVSGLVGGGSGLILTPVQVLLGIDPKLATTTTHFGFIGVSIGALARFKREQGVRRGSVVPLTFLALVSGLLGPFVLLSIEPASFQQMIGGLILLCIPLFVLKENLGADRRSPSTVRQTIGYLLFLIVFVLQVAFGAATGVIAIFILIYFLGLSMLETSAALRVPNLVSSLIGLLVYARYDQIHYTHGIILLVATVLGGYLGSHMAIRGGDRFVKRLFVVFASVLAIILVCSASR
jgi:uncharacterized membrane protein YfcA